MKKRGGTNSVYADAGISSHKMQSSAGKRARRSRSEDIVADEAYELRRAQSVTQKDEKVLEKKIRFLLNPQEFHVVTFVASLIILSFILNSKSLVFYAVLTIGVLAFISFMDKHHCRPDDLVTILAVFFLPLAVTFVLFRDVIVWLLAALYIVSGISTIMHYCRREDDSVLRLMWQLTYSKTIAAMIAVLLACILPYAVLPDSFVSMFELIFIYVLPIAFVFFFVSRFFYIYFFDRRHIVSDIMRSVRHTAIYSFVFIIMLMCLYSLFASGLYNARTEAYLSNLDSYAAEVENIEQSVSAWPEDVLKLGVTEDLLSFSEDLYNNLSSEKSRVSSRTISFSGIMDDTYFTDLSADSFNSLRFVVVGIELDDLKYKIVANDEEIKGMINGQVPFEDGSTNLTGHILNLTRYIEENADFAYQSRTGFFEAVDNPYLDYEYFEQNGFFYWFSKEAGLDFVYGSDSIFGRQLSLVLRHTVIFKDITQLFLKVVVFLDEKSVASPVMMHIYDNADSDRSDVSSAIRYRILKDYVLLSKETVLKARFNFKMDADD